MIKNVWVNFQSAGQNNVTLPPGRLIGIHIAVAGNNAPNNGAGFIQTAVMGPATSTIPTFALLTEQVFAALIVGFGTDAAAGATFGFSGTQYFPQDFIIPLPLRFNITNSGAPSSFISYVGFFITEK